MSLESTNQALKKLLLESKGYPIDESVWSESTVQLRNFNSLTSKTPSLNLQTRKQTTCTAVYWIEAPDSLNGIEWAEKQPWFENLTCQPSKNSLAPSNPKKFKVFYTHPSSEKKSFIAIPRFYGISIFGLPTRDLRSTGVPALQNAEFGDPQRPLRFYQEQACEKGLEFLHKWGGAMLELDCGAGKTCIALSIAAVLKLKTLVICNRSFLMNQWKSDICGILEWTWKDDQSIVPIEKLVQGGLKNIPSDYIKRTCDVCKKTVYSDENRIEHLQTLLNSQCFNVNCQSRSFVKGKRWIGTSSPTKGWFSNVSVGWLQGKIVDIENKDIVISSIDSLSDVKYSKEILSQFGLVIVDECHHIAALTLSQVMPQIPSKYVLGISATPERNDGLEHLIYWLLGPCAFVYKRLPSITGISHTVTIKQIIFSGGLDKTDARMWNGQLAFAEMINRLAEDHERNKVLVDIILKCYLEGRRKILVISSIVDHAKKLKNQLLSHLSNAVSEHDVFSIFGGTRQEIVQKSKTDSARVVFASYAYVGEGYDDATIDTMVLALPRSSIQQIIGRCERVHVGKLTPIVYDVIDDFSIFESMSYKRQKFYKSRGFLCTRSRWIPLINKENDTSKEENEADLK
jgi:superfamily II DNA or RNA helicase